MRIRSEIDATAVRELGNILDEITYGIYTVTVRKRRQKRRRHANTRCARPLSPGVRAEAEPYTYTITNLLAPRGQQDITFTGHNASIDAMSYMLGLLAGKSELSPAHATRVRYWDEEVRARLRHASAHYADDHHYTCAGLNDMRV